MMEDGGKEILTKGESVERIKARSVGKKVLEEMGTVGLDAAAKKFGNERGELTSEEEEGGGNRVETVARRLNSEREKFGSRRGRRIRRSMDGLYSGSLGGVTGGVAQEEPITVAEGTGNDAEVDLNGIQSALERRADEMVADAEPAAVNMEKQDVENDRVWERLKNALRDIQQTKDMQAWKKERKINQREDRKLARASELVPPKTEPEFVGLSGEEEEESWRRLNKVRESIRNIKNERARKVAEKLSRHERAKSAVLKTVRRGLAIAGLSLGIFSSAMSTANAEINNFGGRSEPAKIEVDDRRNEGATFENGTGGIDGMSVDLSSTAEEASGGRLVDMVPVTEENDVSVDLSSTAEETSGGRLVDMVPVTEEESGLRVDLSEGGREHDGESIDVTPAASETAREEESESDQEWEEALEVAEAGDYGNFDDAMSWEEFVKWTDELNENAPFEITTEGEAENYISTGDGGTRLVNRTVDGKIVKG